jgi:hypothetical protein
MGLDIVELVMAVEEGFGIDIADEEAERIVTVGDLRDAILRRLKNPDPFRVWDALCEMIAESAGVLRTQIKPETSLGELGID